MEFSYVMLLHDSPLLMIHSGLFSHLVCNCATEGNHFQHLLEHKSLRDLTDRTPAEIGSFKSDTLKSDTLKSDFLNRTHQ